MCGNSLPSCLVQVLADVLRVGVVGAVPFNGHRPVVCRPENLDACGARAGAPSAEAGEQVDCCGHGGLAGGSVEQVLAAPGLVVVQVLDGLLLVDGEHRVTGSAVAGDLDCLERQRDG